MKKLKNNLTMQESFLKSLLAIYFILGLTWARSSLEKLSGDKFVDSLGVILTKVAKDNPYIYYRQFLESVAIPNSVMFATLTMYGEFLVAVAILISTFVLFADPAKKLFYITLILGLFGGIFLNINFWLAFSYNSVAADSLNLLMLFIEIVGVVNLTYFLLGKNGIISRNTTTKVANQ